MSLSWAHFENRGLTVSDCMHACENGHMLFTKQSQPVGSQFSNVNTPGHKSKYEKVGNGVLLIRIVTSDVSSVGPSSERKHSSCFCSDEGPMLETLDFTIHIGSTPTFSYFDLYLYTLPTHHTTFFVSTQTALSPEGYIYRCFSVCENNSDLE